MMKHRIIVSALMLVVLALPVFAHEVDAEISGTASATSTKVRAEVRTEIEVRKASSTERREERKENIEERKASSTERRIEMQKNLAKRKANHTARVLTATVGRLDKIIVRLESRIAKIDAAGGTTTEAKIFVAEAKNHLSLASTTIAGFVSLDLEGDKAQENFEKIRALASEAKGHIREAHRSLSKAVRTLGRVWSDIMRNKATTTATSTSDSDD